MITPDSSAATSISAAVATTLGIDLTPEQLEAQQQMANAIATKIAENNKDVQKAVREVKTRLRCQVTGVTVGCAPEIFDKRAKDYGSDELLRRYYVSREGKALLREDFLAVHPIVAIDTIRKMYGVTDPEALVYPTAEQIKQIRKWGKDPTAPKGTRGRPSETAAAVPATEGEVKVDLPVAEVPAEELKGIPTDGLVEEVKPEVEEVATFVKAGDVTTAEEPVVEVPAETATNVKPITKKKSGGSSKNSSKKGSSKKKEVAAA